MSGQTQTNCSDVALKIARLVEERGWNQEDFARMAQLNRQTVREIVQTNGTRRLRNATVSACAKALSVSVNELRNAPLERLLAQMDSHGIGNEDVVLRRLYEQATQPELLAWLERNPERAQRITPPEMDELLSLQGTGGPLTRIGVEHFVELIERKRKLLEKIHAVAGTEYLELLEQLVDLLYERVQPYADRV
jgi:hypothetical protein